MVKRLQNHTIEKTEKNKEEKGFLHTAAVRDREETIQEKIRLLHGSFFGKPILKFDIVSMRDVWVPYCYLVYHYNIGGNTFRKIKRSVRDGEVAVVLDLNEMHPMQYDIYESGELKLIKKKSRDESRALIHVGALEADIRAVTEQYIQMKIMKRFYGKLGDLKLLSKKNFFRPAVELEIIYRGENVNKRYAYLDEFGIQSEHILGLKYRVEHKG